LSAIIDGYTIAFKRKMKHLLSQHILWVLSLATLVSCTKETPGPDVSHIQVTFDTVRYDRIMMEWDTSDLEKTYFSFTTEHPVFAELYWGRIVPLRNQLRKDTAAFFDEMKEFLTAPSISAISDSCRLEYRGFEDLYREFKKSFQYYKHYFPDKNVPDVYTYISEFGYATILFTQENGKDAVGIGLDMFLGNRFDYTVLGAFNSAFSQYITRTFNKSHLVKSAMDALVEDMMEAPGNGRMIDYLIYEGKKWYLLDKLMPDTPDSIKWEYTSAQADWVRENEWNIWVFLVDEEILYSTQISDFHRLISPAPTSVGMPPEAPGQAAVYIGYKIVEAYMKRNPQTTLKELLSTNDGQKVLELSKYKPRK
jgi:hypothetical protein